MITTTSENVLIIMRIVLIIIIQIKNTFHITSPRCYKVKKLLQSSGTHMIWTKNNDSSQYSEYHNSGCRLNIHFPTHKSDLLVSLAPHTLCLSAKLWAEYIKSKEINPTDFCQLGKLNLAASLDFVRLGCGLLAELDFVVVFSLWAAAPLRVDACGEGATVCVSCTRGAGWLEPDAACSELDVITADGGGTPSAAVSEALGSLDSDEAGSAGFSPFSLDDLVGFWGDFCFCITCKVQRFGQLIYIFLSPHAKRQASAHICQSAWPVVFTHMNSSRIYSFLMVSGYFLGL